MKRNQTTKELVLILDLASNRLCSLSWHFPSSRTPFRVLEAATHRCLSEAAWLGPGPAVGNTDSWKAGERGIWSLWSVSNRATRGSSLSNTLTQQLSRPPQTRERAAEPGHQGFQQLSLW